MRITLRPTGKRFIYLFSFLVFCYIFLKKRKYSETFEIVFTSVEPKIVWEFWADFSNWQKLNPTVVDFEVEYERGTYESWEYAVTYFEHLALFPLITNSNRGVFKVTPEKHMGHFTQPYRIDSEHLTCFLTFFCLHTDADMTFLKATPVSHTGKNSRQITSIGNTKVVEVVNYECIPLMAPLCRNELRSQRNLIFEKARDIDFSTYKDEI